MCRARLQIVDETKHKQLEQWKDLIVNYHKAHRKAILVVSEFELWQNAAIGCASQRAAAASSLPNRRRVRHWHNTAPRVSPQANSQRRASQQ